MFSWDWHLMLISIKVKVIVELSEIRQCGFKRQQTGRENDQADNLYVFRFTQNFYLSRKKNLNGKKTSTALPQVIILFYFCNKERNETRLGWYNDIYLFSAASYSFFGFFYILVMIFLFVRFLMVSGIRTNTLLTNSSYSSQRFLLGLICLRKQDRRGTKRNGVLNGTTLSEILQSPQWIKLYQQYNHIGLEMFPPPPPLTITWRNNSIQH